MGGVKRAVKWLAAGVAAILVGMGIYFFGAPALSDIRQRPAIEELLTGGKDFELYSIYAGRGWQKGEPRPIAEAGTFLGWPVIGKVAITDAKQVRELVQPFVAASDCFDGAPCPRPMCFQPRHAIRVSHAGKSIELLICFECRQVKGQGIEDFMVGGAPEAAFDQVLRKSGVALSRDIEKKENTPPEAFEAIAEGRVEDVARYLKAGGDPMIRWRGSPAIREAAWKGHHRVLELLLDAGAPVEDAQRKSRSLLQEAAYGGNIEAVRLLIGRKADVHGSAQGDAPLHLATYRGNTEVMAFLLDSGADPNAPNEYHGRTPLHIAASGGKVDAVKLLLARGSSVNQRGKDGETPLQESRKALNDTASPADRREVIRLLEEAAKR
jgi:uncharacterized protein